MEETANSASRASLMLVASRRFVTTAIAPGRPRPQITPSMSPARPFANALGEVAPHRPGEITIGHRLRSGAVFLHLPGQRCPQCDVA